MTRKNFLIILLLLSVNLVSCRHDPLDVDVSNQQFTGEFLDMHAIIYHADSIELMAKDAEFRKEISDIYAYFRGYCLRIGDVTDTAFYNSISLFRTDSIMQIVDKGIEKNFSNLDAYNKQISDGFKHLNYHFSAGKIPENIVYMNSIFQSNVFCTEKEIGIGMERYLGPEDPVIRNLDPTVVFQWIKDGMKKEYLIRDVMEGWIETHYIEEIDGNLAEQIVRAGKVIYLVEASLPELEKHLVLRYDKEQLDWAIENEYGFWRYLVDEKMLFETNERTTTNIVKPGPTTSGLPIQGSPDRMGVYLGWKMIHSYMEQHEISLKELLDVPYNKILNDYEIES